MKQIHRFYSMLFENKLSSHLSDEYSIIVRYGIDWVLLKENFNVFNNFHQPTFSKFQSIFHHLESQLKDE